MRVFVAGATGAIGRRLVPALVERGHEVVGATRTPARTAVLESLGARPVVLDGLDAAAVGEAVARAEPDVVVHQMTALSDLGSLRDFDRVFAATNALRTKGTDHLLDAAAAAGARRFVAQSYTGWTNAPGPGPATEEDPLDPDPPASQRETLAAISHLERAVLAAPVDGVVLRYGTFYGPGASDRVVELVRRRRMPLVGDGKGAWSFVHLDDAAAATVLAVEGGAPGTYNVVDDEPAPVALWLPYLAEVLGARPPRRVPVPLARLLAGSAAVSMTTRARGASNAKVRRELGWEPVWATWREGFRHGLEPAGRTAAAAG